MSRAAAWNVQARRNGKTAIRDFDADNIAHDTMDVAEIEFILMLL